MLQEWSEEQGGGRTEEGGGGGGPPQLGDKKGKKKAGSFQGTGFFFPTRQCCFFHLECGGMWRWKMKVVITSSSPHRQPRSSTVHFKCLA